MPDFLFRMSNSSLFFLLAVFFVVISIVAVCLLRCLISHEVRYRENAVIGNVSATISVIHGVLVGLIALYLVNSNNAASDAILKEANAAANIYRDSAWLQGGARTEIRDEVRRYLIHAIHSDWDFMIQGYLPDDEGGRIIQTISSQLFHYPITTPQDNVIMSDLLQEVHHLYDYRQLRIQASTFALGPETWVVILMGTFLTIGMNYFFGMNIYIHLLATTALALMMASILFLIISLDKPFQGEFVVGPDPLQGVLTHIEKDIASMVQKQPISQLPVREAG